MALVPVLVPALVVVLSLEPGGYQMREKAEDLECHEH
jgi:hypothetical protein